MKARAEKESTYVTIHYVKDNRRFPND
jgi:hypothetical protein